MENHEDHSTTTHTYKCPVEGCPVDLEVHAHDEDDAVQKIMMSGKTHFDKAHPDAPAMSPEEMESATRSGMQTH